MDILVLLLLAAISEPAEPSIVSTIIVGIVVIGVPAILLLFALRKYLVSILFAATLVFTWFLFGPVGKVLAVVVFLICWTVTLFNKEVKAEAVEPGHKDEFYR